MNENTAKPSQEYTRVQKPAPSTQYGPTFDEIERRDPVQWYMASQALKLEQLVRKKMVIIYQERMEECYLRERHNYLQNCREIMTKYLHELKEWRNMDSSSKDGNTDRFRVPLVSMYKEVDDLYEAKYGSPGQYEM